ncbi:MAG: hypothetical protein MH204_04240 [Fimbriimonadaceae bacterium]|nr:hypothetical protein [Fimbriimonadaceae bacterium]
MMRRSLSWIALALAASVAVGCAKPEPNLTPAPPAAPPAAAAPAPGAAGGVPPAATPPAAPATPAEADSSSGGLQQLPSGSSGGY